MRGMPRWSAAARRLRAADPRLRRVIDHVGPLPAAARTRDHFAGLCRIIVGQQLSSAAASTIWRRALALAPEWTPERVARLRAAQLQRCGFSRRKADFVRDAARRVLSGELDLDALARLDEAAAREVLLTVKGFGPWSVEMYQIFQLGMADVFSPGDAGLRRAMCRLYELDRDRFAAEAEAIAARWSPHRSLACRYLWRWIDVAV